MTTPPPPPTPAGPDATLGHVLVIGGTGMLRAAALHLSRRADVVTVLARTASRLASLQRDALPRRIETVALDWHDAAAVGEAVVGSSRRDGPIGLAVAWVHSSACGVPAAVAAALSATSPGCRLFLVVGSREDAEQPVKRGWHDQLSAAPGIVYRRVRLGRHGGPSGRWLTDDEISRGVVDAVSADARDALVGDAW